MEKTTKKLLVHLILIIIGMSVCQNGFSQSSIINLSSRYLYEVEGTVRLNLSNENGSENTFYPSDRIPYGITMTKANNIVDRSGHWEFMCIGKRKGLAYAHNARGNNWSSTIGLEEGYAYVARVPREYDPGWHTYVNIYCDKFVTGPYGGVIGAKIEYITDVSYYGAVTPEIFEEGFKVYDPVLANLFLMIADNNDDSMISQEERLAITEIHIAYQDKLYLLDGNTYLQYFPNIRGIDIGPFQREDKVYQGKSRACYLGFGVYTDKLIIESPNVDTINIGWNNEIKHIDLSKCPNLKKVTINSVSCIDVVLPTSIEQICTYENVFENMDLSNCNNLYHIQINNSQCKNLVLPSSAITVFCQHGQLSSIDLSRNEKLKYLDLRDNNLTSIDVSHCVNLEHLIVSKNKLTELNTKNCGSSLVELTCWSNPIKSLDVSHHEFLNILYCGSCDFEELDLSANKFILWLELKAKGYDSTLKKVYLPSDHMYKGKYYVGDFDHPTDFDGIQIVYR